MQACTRCLCLVLLLRQCETLYTTLDRGDSHNPKMMMGEEYKNNDHIPRAGSQNLIKINQSHVTSSEYVKNDKITVLYNERPPVRTSTNSLVGNHANVEPQHAVMNWTKLEKTGSEVNQNRYFNAKQLVQSETLMSKTNLSATNASLAQDSRIDRHSEYSVVTPLVTEINVPTEEYSTSTPSITDVTVFIDRHSPSTTYSTAEVTVSTEKYAVTPSVGEVRVSTETSEGYITVTRSIPEGTESIDIHPITTLASIAEVTESTEKYPVTPVAEVKVSTDFSTNGYATTTSIAEVTTPAEGYSTTTISVDEVGLSTERNQTTTASLAGETVYTEGCSTTDASVNASIETSAKGYSVTTILSTEGYSTTATKPVLSVSSESTSEEYFTTWMLGAGIDKPVLGLTERLVSLSLTSDFGSPSESFNEENSTPSTLVPDGTACPVPSPPSDITVRWGWERSSVKWHLPNCGSARVNNFAVFVKCVGPAYDCWNSVNLCFHNNSTIVQETEFIFPVISAYHYEVSVATVTDGKIGIFSRPQAGITDTSVPEAPNHVTVDTNAGELHVMWDPPNCTAGEVTKYTVNITCLGPQLDCNNTQCISVVQSTRRTQFNFTSSRPYHSYFVAVAASTKAGRGEFSEPQIIATPPAVPGPPNDVTVDFNAGELHVMWDPPNCNAGEVTNYTVKITCLRPQFDCNNTQCISVVKFTRITQYHFKSSRPYHLYSVAVAASTKAGQGEFSEPQIIVTPPAEPKPVQKLEYYLQRNHAGFEVTLKWYYPCQNQNGQLNSFRGNFTGIRHYYHDHCYDWLYYTSGKSDQVSYKIEESFKPGYNYTVTVGVITTGWDNYTFRSKPATITFTTPGGIPKRPPLLAVNKLISDKQLHLHLSNDLFSADMGDILWYAVIVAEDGRQEESRANLYQQLPVLATWANSEAGRNEQYQATPNNWNPFRNGSSHEVFVLGDNISCNVGTNIMDYCNGPLKPSTKYTIKIRAYTNGGFQDTPLLFFETAGTLNVGLVVGIIILILLVGLMITVLITYRSGRLSWNGQAVMRRSSHSVRPPSTPVRKFPAYCAELLDTPSRLSSEYQLLATLSADLVSSNTTCAAQMPENKKKNRYLNILPYDYTRVKLDLINSDPSSDYINASLIKGFSGRIEYIASQGPKEETCCDFWRMVFQYNVQVIVMLTQFEEQNKRKCHQYFPRLHEDIIYGENLVHCTTELHFPIFTVRTLVLQRSTIKKHITHLHFSEWPDFGCPLTTEVMLQFCQRVRKHAAAADPGLSLVHCSAGVGRTGTLIALDILLQCIQYNKDIDIFGTVYGLRKQRTNMVQTEVQYTYLYKCVRDAIIDSSFLKAAQSLVSMSLEPIYENVGSGISLTTYEKKQTASSESESEL